MNRVFLGLGSNRGDRLQYIHKAIRKIAQHFALNNTSNIIETESIGPSKRKYLNLVTEISTIYSPNNVLEKILKLEKKLDRERIEKWGSRTIDIDILFYDNIIMTEAKLSIPHHELHKRAFVLESLCEINPYLYHPVLKKTCMKLLEELKIERLKN